YDLPGNEPVEQHAHGRKLLLHTRRPMCPLQVFHPGRYVERPDGGEREPAIFAPGEKPAAGARIGPPRVIVVDVGGKEFDVAPVGLIADLGEAANWRYVEFFTANINNDHTRRAYARACSRFFAWCENRGLSLTDIRPFDVAAWVKDLQQTHGAPGVKQQLAAVRMLFDWLITGQIVPMNPAAAVRGPKHVVKTGKTPVLDGDEWRKLLASVPTTTLRDLRDRALIATLTYSFARITAALKMKVEDLRPRGAGWTVRLHEKGGKLSWTPKMRQVAK